MNDGDLLLGLDLGISTARAALFTPEGQLVGLAAEEYLVMSGGNPREVEDETYWAPIARAIRELLRRWGGDPACIVAVAVSSHGETVFPLGHDGRLVRPPLIWSDVCSQGEADELAAEIGAPRVLETSGQPEISPIWPVTKMRWMAKNEPEHVRCTRCFLLPGDYILFKLSGALAGDQTLWGSSLVMDIRRKTWADDLVAFAGVRRAQLPPLHSSGTAVSSISEECASETGLSPRTRVIVGAMDQMCAAVGAGNVSPGVVTESTGSVLALLITIPQPIFDADTKVPCHIHALPQTYCLLPWNPTGGLTLKWFKDRFAPAAAEGKGDPYELLTAEAAGVPPGCDGLVMLPHLEGALYPEFNAAARAVFFGFTLGHTRGHFTRAILEAVAFMMRRDLAGIRGLGADPREVRSLGGGAKSRLWAQIKADVLGLPVVVPAQSEAAALGAALLAGVGAGLYPGIPAAVQAMVQAGDPVMPDTAHRATYDAAFDLYVALYEVLKPLFPRSAALHPVIGKGIRG